MMSRPALTAIATLLLAPLTHAGVAETLDTLYTSGRSLQTLAADVSMHSGDTSLGDDKTKLGRFVMQKLPNDDMRLRATFTETRSGNRIVKEKLDYLMADTDLVERNYTAKKETIRQVRQPGQKLDLFKLGEGPFPLPIGQKPADVLKEFNVTELPTTDAAAMALIELKPKPGAQVAKGLKSITVLVDRATKLPRVITTTDENEADVTTVTLSNVKVNDEVKLADAEFKLDAIDPAEWNRVGK